MFDAVLFDWCGTLVGYPDEETRIRPALEALGRPSDVATVGLIAQAIRIAESDPRAIEADRRCDLSAASHAESKRVLFEVAGIDHELGAAIERTYGDLATYTTYPEVVDVFNQLADHGIEIAIVSDFHVDLRPYFAALGLLDRVAGFAISYEVGVTKPHAAMFEAALATISAPPERCLMVGDNPRPDCGAAALGITTLILPVPKGPRPPLLDRVTSLVF
jgi:HAD superfamily hydrolase (TIGR01509 family)